MVRRHRTQSQHIVNTRLTFSVDDFAARFRSLRSALNLTQGEVGELLGVTKQSVSGYESGRSKPSYEVLKDGLSVHRVNIDWLLTGKGQMFEPAASAIESNAELVDMGAEVVWVPLYPAFLDAGHPTLAVEDIEPEGAFPIPNAFARSAGLWTGDGPAGRLFSAYVRGDSMRDDFDDGDIVFGVKQKEFDREAVYALYLEGAMLVKRVTRTRKGYDLVSTNPAYPRMPIVTEDVRIIGRVVGSLNRL